MLALVCAAAMGLLAGGCRRQVDLDSVRPTKHPSASSAETTTTGPLAETSESEDSPHEAPSRSRREVTALHKEELEVAHQFLEDFGSGVDGLGLLGSVYRNHGRSAEAVKCWQKCVELDPRRLEPYDAMASVALERGEYERVVTLLKTALGIQPRLPQLRNRLARALMGLGRTEEAARVLEEDVRLFPQAVNSHFFLGRAYAELQQYEKARQCFARAIQLQPNHSQACYQMAAVCQRLGRSDEATEYRKKFQTLKEASRTNLRGRKGQADERFDLAAVRRSVARTEAVAAAVYLRRGNLQRAGQLWQRAVQLDPDNAQYHTDLGNLLAQSGQFPEAERAFRRVIELDSDRPAGFVSLAKVYLAQNMRLAEAKELAQAAVRMEPAASNYLILARACSETGDLAGAVAAIEQAVTLEPNNAEYRRIYAMLKKDY
jgi:tetratricopeptide (TPR) repeat protein